MDGNEVNDDWRILYTHQPTQLYASVDVGLTGSFLLAEGCTHVVVHNLQNYRKMQDSLKIIFIVNTFDVNRELDCIYLNYKKGCHTCLILATECTAVALRRSFNFFNWSLGRCDVPVSFLNQKRLFSHSKSKKTICCSLFSKIFTMFENNKQNRVARSVISYTFGIHLKEMGLSKNIDNKNIHTDFSLFAFIFYLK